MVFTREMASGERKRWGVNGRRGRPIREKKEGPRRRVEVWDLKELSSGP